MKFINTLGIISKIKYYYLGLMMFLLASASFANTIVIAPNTVISHSTTYDDVTLDMTHGSFIVKGNATLTISNSIVNGTLSEENPLLINVDAGTLNLKKNQFNITSEGIDPHATTQSLQYVVQLAMASLNMNGNSFEIDKPFRSGLLITSASIPTSGISIVNNIFKGFHGVIYLLGTDNALISGNTLIKNTYGNIVLIGSNSQIIGNTIKFSGNNRLGNSIDVIDSNDITVSNNLLLTPTCHGIYIFNSQDVTLNTNRIFGGITYGMTVLSYPEKFAAKDRDYVKSLMGKHQLKNTLSTNIIISNNLFSQNRYGLAASDVSGLNASNNIFIQRFVDNDARKFWTNNNVLMQNVTNVIWTNNLYKEAFTQADGGNNSKSLMSVPFPQNGGVSL